MRDLRKRALVQSGKKQSRKARNKENARPSYPGTPDSKQSPESSPHVSQASSRGGSRANSRPGSRYASSKSSESDNEEYDPWDSDGDDEFASDDESEEAWIPRLRECIGTLQENRKRSLREREENLQHYLHINRHHLTQDHIAGSFHEIIASLKGTIDKPKSKTELVTSLNALSATLVNCPSDALYGVVSTSLKGVCQESKHETAKVAAMNALAAALAFAGGSQADMQDIAEFLLEAVESDGQSIDAEDNGVVVAGALRAWGFVASYFDNLAETTEDGRAMEAFIEQLDSTDVGVQVSAGYNIAQLCEAAREEEKRTKRKTGLQHLSHMALTGMRDILKHWTKSTPKEHRRLQRAEFPAIILSIERGVGPGYQEKGTIVGDAFESNNWVQHPLSTSPPLSVSWLQKKKTKLERNEGTAIWDWQQHARYAVLKQILEGGMRDHWLANPAVQSALRASPGRGIMDDEEDEEEEEEEEVVVEEEEEEDKEDEE